MKAEAFQGDNPDLLAVATKRLKLETALGDAIDKEQFEVHCQPIMALQTLQVTACEALVRWRHPERGMVPPLNFFRIAEDTGLIVENGEWVLRTACKDIARFPAPIKVAVSQFLAGPVQRPSPRRHRSAGWLMDWTAES